MTMSGWRRTTVPLVFEGAGRRQLKGFEEPVLVYSVLLPPRAGRPAGDQPGG